MMGDVDGTLPSLSGGGMRTSTNLTVQLYISRRFVQWFPHVALAPALLAVPLNSSGYCAMREI